MAVRYDWRRGGSWLGMLALAATACSGAGGGGGNSAHALGGIAAITAGSEHTCALLDDGTLRCWGADGNGQLGDGAASGGITSVPVTVTGVTGAVDVDAGPGYTCAVLGDGSVRCWGYNASGQVGDGTTTDVSTPTTVAGVSGVDEVSASFDHTCAVGSSGGVWCWGGNGAGQLGNGTFTSSLSAVATGISGVTALTGGSQYTCALLPSGGMSCWGRADSGALGSGNESTNFPPSSPIPATVVVLSNVTAIARTSGENEHQCVIEAGAVKCWGSNQFGQLGRGLTSSDLSWSATPTAVTGISNAVSVAVGDYYACAVLNDGTVRCWGINVAGELGNGTTTDSTSPVTVSGIDTADSIAAGGQHACALLSDGTARCWGDNIGGQLGNPGVDNFGSTTPVTVLE